MKRLLKLLLITTLVLPLATGAVAVLSGFGDPWGMGAKNPMGVFVTAALPVFIPGLYQVLAWPLTYGVALALSPLALLRRRWFYLIAVLLYLAAISGFWLLGWVLAPDRLDVIFDGKSYVPGRLDSNTWKLGVYLLTDSVLLAVTTLWWFWREHAPTPSLQGTPASRRP